MGDFPSNERVLESFRSKLVKEGFDVTIYEPENFETAKFDVGTFKKSYDLVIYIGNVENASNKVTNRLSWYTFWGNGNNVPWFVAERPVMFISLANPYHLIDVPMIKTYINGYSNSEYVIESVVEKIMGRSAFTGKNPVDNPTRNTSTIFTAASTSQTGAAIIRNGNFIKNLNIYCRIFFALLVLLSRLKNTYWMCSYLTFSKRLLTTCVGTASPLIC